MSDPIIRFGPWIDDISPIPIAEPTLPDSDPANANFFPMNCANSAIVEWPFTVKLFRRRFDSVDPLLEEYDLASTDVDTFLNYTDSVSGDDEIVIEIEMSFYYQAVEPFSLDIVFAATASGSGGDPDFTTKDVSVSLGMTVPDGTTGDASPVTDSDSDTGSGSISASISDTRTLTFPASPYSEKVSIHLSAAGTGVPFGGNHPSFSGNISLSIDGINPIVLPE